MVFAGVLVFLQNYIWLRNYVSAVIPIVSLNFKRGDNGCASKLFRIEVLVSVN